MISNALMIIERYLEAYGWSYQQQDTSALAARFVGPSSDTEFAVLFRITEHWLSITVWPLLPRPAPSRRGPLAELLSRMNYDLKLAKLAMTPEEDIIMSLELPLEHLTEDLFTLALDTISFYADEAFPQLVVAWTGESD